MMRKVLVAVISAAALGGLTLCLVLLSAPAPAVSHSSYTWKPGCHCGAPTTTTKKATTTTKKVTTATTRATTTATGRTIPSTTSSETTTTLGSALTAQTGDWTYLWGRPDTQRIWDRAEGIVAGIALSSLVDPPRGDGTAGGSAADEAAGLEPVTDEAASDGGVPETDQGAVVEDAAAAASETAADLGPPQYYVSPVAIVFLLIYGGSFALYKNKTIRVTTHRKIWNLLLLATFLVTGAFGVLLAVGISMDPPLLLPRWLLFWHVETGVVMSFISSFHLGWHLRYYLAVLTGGRKPGRKAAAEAAGDRV